MVKLHVTDCKLDMWGLFFHYLFLISLSIGASGRLRFVVVAFLGYVH